MRCNVLVFNELPTERKRVKLSQEFYALHTSTTRTYSCFFNSFCVLHYHADLSGVPKVTRVSCIRSYTIKTNVSQRREFRKWLRYFVFWAILLKHLQFNDCLTYPSYTFFQIVMLFYKSFRTNYMHQVSRLLFFKFGNELVSIC